jgi:hypothetical protein
MNSEQAANRAVKRELLIARAAAERAALAGQLDGFDFRTRKLQSVAQLAAGGLGWMPASPPLATAASALRYVRERPWLVSTGIAVASRLAKSRALRWFAAAAVIGAGIWIARRALEAGPTTEPPDPSG